MTVDNSWIPIIISTSVILVTIGVTYGDARARLTRIEKVLFNGHFLSKDVADERQEEQNRRLTNIEERIGS